MNQFQILQKLGEGAFSNVYKVRRIADGHEYALKQVTIYDRILGEVREVITKGERKCY